MKRSFGGLDMNTPVSRIGAVAVVSLVSIVPVAIRAAEAELCVIPRPASVVAGEGTPAARKDYASFEARLPATLAHLRSLGIAPYDPFANSAEITDAQAEKPKAHLD